MWAGRLGLVSGLTDRQSSRTWSLDFTCQSVSQVNVQKTVWNYRGKSCQTVKLLLFPASSWPHGYMIYYTCVSSSPRETKRANREVREPQVGEQPSESDETLNWKNWDFLTVENCFLCKRKVGINTTIKLLSINARKLRPGDMIFMALWQKKSDIRRLYRECEKVELPILAGLPMNVS